MVTKKMENAMINLREAAIELATVWDEQGYRNDAYPFTEDFETMVLNICEWVNENVALSLWDQFLLENNETDDKSAEQLARFEKYAPYVVAAEYDEEEGMDYMLYTDGKKHRTNEEIIFRSTDLASAKQVIRDKRGDLDE